MDPKITLDEYQWGYNRMMTVDGLFGAGDTLGGTFSQVFIGIIHRRQRPAGKAANKYVDDLGSNVPEVDEKEYMALKEAIYQPLENYRVGRNEITAGTVSPSYLLPLQVCKDSKRLWMNIVVDVANDTW